MEGGLPLEFAWALIIVGGMLFLIVLVKIPESLVAVLMVGPSYIQLVFGLFGLHQSRGQLATAVAVIFIPLVLLFVIMRMVQTRGETGPVIGRPNYGFILLTIVMGSILLVGLTWTPCHFYGNQKAVEYFVFGLMPMLVAFVFLRDRAGVHRLLMWVTLFTAGTVVAVSALSLITKGTVFTLLQEIPAEGETMAIRGHGALSTPLVITTAALFAFAGGRTRRIWQVLPVICLPVIAFFIVMSGTRSNLVAFIAVVLAGSFFAYRRHRGVLVALLGLVVLTALFLYLYAPEDVHERMFGNWFEDDTTGSSGGGRRLDMLKTCITESAAAPLLGHGTGAWPMVAYGIEAYEYPHNMFGEMLVENGAVGLLVLLLLWFVVVRRVWRCLRDSEPGAELYGLAIFGAGLLASELATGLGHFGLAHHSCTLLLMSGVILRSTYVIESAQELQRPDGGEADALVRPVLDA